MNLHKKLGVNQKTAQPGDLLNAAKKYKIKGKFSSEPMCKSCKMKHAPKKHKFVAKFQAKSKKNDNDADDKNKFVKKGTKKHKFVKKFQEKKSKK